MSGCSVIVFVRADGRQCTVRFTRAEWPPFKPERAAAPGTYITGCGEIVEKRWAWERAVDAPVNCIGCLAAA